MLITPILEVGKAATRLGENENKEFAQIKPS
jgi:hypothetical protein